MVRWWPAPAAGDIVWCHFPYDIAPREPGPKPRPALVLTVLEDDAPQFWAQVAYGTSQRTDQLFAGEFVIHHAQDLQAYVCAGLSYDTKFNLGQIVELPFNSDWFAVPPHAPHGQTPLLGTLHPSLIRRAAAAHAAVS